MTCTGRTEDGVRCALPSNHAGACEVPRKPISPSDISNKYKNQWGTIPSSEVAYTSYARFGKSRQGPTIPQTTEDEMARKKKNPGELMAPAWMHAHVALNPSYNGWRPGWDYMKAAGDGWDSATIFDSWSDMKVEIDDRNIVATFYFEIDAEWSPCQACEQSGWNPATRELYRTFGPHLADDPGRSNRRGWRCNMTEDELDVLVKRRYISAEDRRDIQNGRLESVGRLMSGAVDSVVKVRGERLGVYGFCAECAGNTKVATTPARLDLYLWFLYPRKGASSGGHVKGLSQADAREARAWLREAARQNAARFAKLEEPNEATLEDESTADRYEKTCEIGERWLEVSYRWKHGGRKESA